MEMSSQSPKTTLRDRQKKWVVEYLTDVRGVSRHMSLGCAPTYDAELEFVDDFSKAFPGRSSGPSLALASRRLRVVLNELADDGCVVKARLCNEKDTRNDPAWQYVYKLR